MKLAGRRRTRKGEKEMKKSLIALTIAAVAASVPMFAAPGQNPPDTTTKKSSSKPKKAKKPAKQKHSKTDSTTPAK
jgi:hypothetical protein